jgi:phage gp36-like protein
MAFISKTDLGSKILLAELDQITGGDDNLINQAIDSAQAEMRSHLYDWYDVETIFSKTSTERNQLLVDLLSDMAIYRLVARVQAGQDVEDRRARYKRAIDWLKLATKPANSADKIYPDLPLRETGTAENKINYSSNPKRNHNLF